ncbi:MAG: hypothetical protein GDA46_01925 [Bdellovibrionales bacterium]|nr:hypothetical protein [Bdellovibrionales bacterium]
MRRRDFVKLNLLYSVNFFLLGFSLFKSKLSHRNYKVTHITNLPYKMNQSEYKNYKKNYINNEKDQSLFKEYKEEILEEKYSFTGTQSIHTLYFKDQRTAFLFKKKYLSHVMMIDKMKKMKQKPDMFTI